MYYVSEALFFLVAEFSVFIPHDTKIILILDFNTLLVNVKRNFYNGGKESQRFSEGIFYVNIKRTHKAGVFPK